MSSERGQFNMERSTSTPERQKIKNKKSNKKEAMMMMLMMDRRSVVVNLVSSAP